MGSSPGFETEEGDAFASVDAADCAGEEGREGEDWLHEGKSLLRGQDILWLGLT